MSVAVVMLSESALPLGKRIASVLTNARLHGLAERVAGADEEFTDTGAHLRDLFAAGTPIVGLCATGLLIRVLAPLLSDKRAEPPVLAVAEDGSAVIPLLGGHHGANDLARAIGSALGVVPAVTTAGDLRFGIAFDEPPPGYALANPHNVKAFTAALLAGAKVRMSGSAPWLQESRLPFAAGGMLSIAITPHVDAGGPSRLVYHPRVLAVGVGCERGTAPEELMNLVRTALGEAGLTEAAVAGVYSLDLKSDEPAVHRVAEMLAAPLRFFSAVVLEAEAPRLLNPSAQVFAEVGCHGVAEGAALAAAGPRARLVLPKQKSTRATVAVAEAPEPFEGTAVGAARGCLYVVGTGPGGEDWLTPEARRLIGEASDLVGYRLYLDLLGPLAESKRRHDFALGEEVARVRVALALAAEGRKVALVSSGDPGIYAMASLVFEQLANNDEPAWRRIAVRVAPGISALQAAAARIGAPLGHDFCAISLSDLLTPWQAIERRIQAAAEADFVIAFYNPVSERRTRQLARAREILLASRGSETPVVLARNLGRAGESVDVTTLGSLDMASVDMLTLVLVGASTTRVVMRNDGGRFVYTPRGYGDKTATLE